MWIELFFFPFDFATLTSCCHFLGPVVCFQFVPMSYACTMRALCIRMLWVARWHQGDTLSPSCFPFSDWLGSSVYLSFLLGLCLDIEYIWLHRFLIQYVTFMKRFTQNKEQRTNGNGNLTAAALLEHSAVKRMRGPQKSTEMCSFQSLL